MVLLTVCYTYAALRQWWRLRHLTAKLMDTLCPRNALVIFTSVKNDAMRATLSGNATATNGKLLGVENLLFCNTHHKAVGCTVVPRRVCHLRTDHWLQLPSVIQRRRRFPIDFSTGAVPFFPPPIETKNTLYTLLRASLSRHRPKFHNHVLQVQALGELVAWRLSNGDEFFELVLRTDIAHLSRLVNIFSCTRRPVVINHHLELVSVEVVNVDEAAISMRYDRVRRVPPPLKSFYTKMEWQQFVTSLNDLYGRAICPEFVSKPKITVENDTVTNTPEDGPKKRPHRTSGTNNSISNATKHKSGHHRDRRDSTDRKSRNNLDVELSRKSRRSSHTEKHSKGVVQDEAPTNGTVQRTKDKADDSVGASLRSSHRRRHHQNGGKSKVETSNGQANGQPVVRINVQKPLNVLVYADSVMTRDNVKRILYTVMTKDRYTIYDMPIPPSVGNTAAQIPPAWFESTALVVICGTVPQHVSNAVITYLVKHAGRVLCLCSDLMYTVLRTYTTTEVRENELVRFSYGNWRHVKMLHHIFCYQASPARKQFPATASSGDSSNNGEPNNTAANSHTKDIKRNNAPSPSNVILTHNGCDHMVHVQVLGTEETWHTPSLLLAKIKQNDSKRFGKAVFSQVHLEVDPDEYENDEDKFRCLQGSNEARFDILRDILSKHLDVSCETVMGAAPSIEGGGGAMITYLPGYFLGRYDLKMEFLSTCVAVVDNQLNADRVCVVFCTGQKVDPGEVSDTRLPVLIHSCPLNFSTVDYFEHLHTEHLGRLIIYADVLASTHRVLSHRLHHGLAVIGRQQTHGVGRTSNVWLSPVGSANVSIQMHCGGRLGNGALLPLVQHVAGVACVRALIQLFGLSDDKEMASNHIRLKWPNDIMLVEQSEQGAICMNVIKVGGILVTSSLMGGQMAVVNIGCGVNLINAHPTVSVLDFLERKSLLRRPRDEITLERYFALLFNELEIIMNAIEESKEVGEMTGYVEDGVQKFKQLYYKHWLHQNAVVRIQQDENSAAMLEGRVVGIDDYGYLMVMVGGKDNEQQLIVRPDGNSFDMMKGLIAPKRL